VGPAGLLSSLGIPVIVNLPGVGEDLQDHFYARTFWRCNRAITLNDDMTSLWRKAGMVANYVFRRKGPLTISAGYAAAFVRTRPESTRPDAQIYFINFSTAKRGGVLHAHSGFTLSLSQLQAESRGWVRIRSPEPAAPPAIHYNYLSAESERRTMVEGLKFVRRLAAARPLADYVAGEFQPGDRVKSDADWLEYCRESGDTVFHPTSTCRMGEDARAVVDARLRVRGLQSLRVIDASVMPAVVSGNTNAAVFAIAERGAELVRADAR